MYGRRTLPCATTRLSPDAAARPDRHGERVELSLIAPLVVLALIDSTSFGTLLIPVWFMLAPGGVRAARLLVFLGTVAGFYLGVGIALMSGATALLTSGPSVLDHPAVGVGQLVLGVALFIWSFFIGKKPKRTDQVRGAVATPSAGVTRGAGATDLPDGAPRQEDAAPPRPGRVLRWRARAMGADGAGWGALVGLALGAATVEVASMLPYLGAIGLLSAADLGTVQRVVVLAGYCLVMVLPALVLLALRLVASRLVEPMLARVAAWMERTGVETTAWIVGIVGFLIARDALMRFPGLLDGLGVTVS